MVRNNFLDRSRMYLVYLSISQLVHLVRLYSNTQLLRPILDVCLCVRARVGVCVCIYVCVLVSSSRRLRI